MNYKVAFGKVFRRLRLERGLTQEAFDPAISVRYVRNLEKGEYSPSLATVRGLCDVLAMSPVTLVALVEAEFVSGDPAQLIQLAGSELHEVGAK
ncbi:helix-turn-helix domain-containing protein [Pseudomonas xanthosomatis]|uniref:helix-turn-helix domain-containing protein n=1 Tax=Pseudomonas xanthosomatis TaxID=2842356 RepID=UPI003513E6DE